MTGCAAFFRSSKHDSFVVVVATTTKHAHHCCCTVASHTHDYIISSQIAQHMSDTSLDTDQMDSLLSLCFWFCYFKPVPVTTAFFALSGSFRIMLQARLKCGKTLMLASCVFFRHFQLPIQWALNAVLSMAKLSGSADNIHKWVSCACVHVNQLIQWHIIL